MRPWKQFGLLLLTIACLLAVGSASAATITFRSGDGAIGTADPNVRVLPKLSGSTRGFLSLGLDDFAAARAGDSAVVVARNTTYNWIASLPTDSAARWINISGNQNYGSEPTGLYAIKIVNPYGPATDATLDLYYAVDNSLGYRNGTTVYTSAVYLNNEPLEPTIGNIAAIPDGDSATPNHYQQVHYLQFTNLPLKAGENWIYINATNTGLMGGVIFSGTFTFTPVPEPVSLSLLVAGAAGLRSRRRR